MASTKPESRFTKGFNTAKNKTIILKKAVNKNCGELNFLQKFQW